MNRKRINENLAVMFMAGIAGLVVLSNAVAVVAPQEEWNKTYGGIYYDGFWSIQKTADSGFILVGLTQPDSASGLKAWLIKVDAGFNQTWNQTFIGIGQDQIKSVRQTADGGYILAGYTGIADKNVWLIKTDNNGNQIWAKTFGGPNIDYATSVQQTMDGGYILAGGTMSFGAGSIDAWLIKTDDNGNQVWAKTFGGANADEFYSVQQTIDGGYILAGSTESFGAGQKDVWLVKTDVDGNHLWNRTFGGLKIDIARYVHQNTDGSFILAGYTSSFGAGFYDAWLIKTDINGNHLWNRTFGGTSYDYVISANQTIDGGYILAGYTSSFGAGEEDAWLIKTDVDGNHLWNRTFGGTSYDFAFSVQQTADGGYLLAGDTYSFGDIEGDAWLIKVSSDTDIPIPGGAGPDRAVISGDTVNFEGSGIGNIVEYRWNFGDGDTSEQKNPAHRFRGSPHGKVYIVTLITKDINGNIVTDTASVTVNPLEKTLEVRKDERYVKMILTYNWVSAKKGYDEYVLNRIDYEHETGIFTGSIGFSIEKQSCAVVCGTIWHEDLFITNTDIQDEGVITVGYYSLPASYYDTPEDKFYGLTVVNEDYASVYINGWIPVEKLAPSWIEIDICTGFPPSQYKYICEGAQHILQYYGLSKPDIKEDNSIEFNPNPGSSPMYLIPQKALFEIVHIASPGDLRVYDSQNNITGMVNGTIKEDIPFSYYNEINKTVIIMNPAGEYRYEVKGTNDGIYGLYVAHLNFTDFNATLYFNAQNMPITSGQDHQYVIDWNALSLGENGVTLQIDYESDGTFDRTIEAAALLTNITLPEIRYINGTVIDSINRTGIAGVTIRTNTSILTTTDATGFYSLNVSEGVYSLTAKFDPTYYVNNTIKVSTIKKAVVIQDIELVKKPKGNIKGGVRRK